MGGAPGTIVESAPVGSGVDALDWKERATILNRLPARFPGLQRWSLSSASGRGGRWKRRAPKFSEFQLPELYQPLLKTGTERQGRSRTSRHPFRLSRPSLQDRPSHHAMLSQTIPMLGKSRTVTVETGEATSCPGTICASPPYSSGGRDRINALPMWDCCFPDRYCGWP